MLLASIVVAALAAAAGTAAAHTYCVGTPGSDGCTGPVRDASKAGLLLAIADAEADTDPTSQIKLGPSTIAIDSPVSLAPDHPVEIIGSPVTAWSTFEWTGGSGTMFSFDGSGAGGDRSSVTAVRFVASGDVRALNVNSVDLISNRFELTYLGSKPTGVVAEGASSIQGTNFEGHQAMTRAVSVTGPDVSVFGGFFRGDGNLHEGIVQTDPTTHDYHHLTFTNVAAPLASRLGTMVVEDSLIELGSIANADAATAANQTSTDAQTAVKLDGSTIIGNGSGQTAVSVSSLDAQKPAHATLDSTLVDLKGSGARFAFCSTGGGNTGVAGVSATYSMFPTAASMSTIESGCTPTSIDGSDIDVVTHPPIYRSPDSPEPRYGSPVIDAGNPAAVRIQPAYSLGAGVRKWSLVGPPRMDIGAFEWEGTFQPGDFPSWTRPGHDDDDDDESVRLVFQKSVGKFRPAKRPFGFRIVKKRPSGARIPVTADARAGVRLRIRKLNAGYSDGFDCKPMPSWPGQQRRCALPIRGARSVVLPAGRSYLVFGGKWNKKRLPAGRYRLVVEGRLGGECWVTFTVTR